MILNLKKSLGKQELIDTLWNVNLHTMTTRYRQILELIDTLWNVNRRGQTSKNLNLLELIDTLWNVNSENKRFQIH